MESKFKPGMIVRYRPEWCDPEERRYLHVLKENRLNPVTGEMSRWLMVCINSALSIPPSEDVEECMIEPTGIDIDNYISNT